MRRYKVGASLAVFCTFLASAVGAQTTNTTCTGFGNQVNCTATTTPSAQQQQDASMRAFQQSMANLGAALAQRKAEKEAQQRAWQAAATDQAREAAEVARANYDATTAALQRFAADTSTNPGTAVNADLTIDWSVLNGVEWSYTDKSNKDYDVDWTSSWAFTDTPDGQKVLRGERVGIVTKRGLRRLKDREVVYNYKGSIRLFPSSAFMMITHVGESPSPYNGPGYMAAIRSGVRAFQAGPTAGKGFDVVVPPGTLDGRMLHPAIAAMAGPIPDAFRIWIVNESGEVVPVDVKVVGRGTFKEPVGAPDGNCAGVKGKGEKRETIKLTISGGVPFESIEVLATAPHLGVFPELNCRIVRQ